MKSAHAAAALAALAAFVAAAPNACPNKSWKPDYCVRERVPTNSTTIPRRYGMVLFPAFELLDVFGPLEAFTRLSGMYQLELHLLSETMEPVTVRPLTEAMNPFNSSFYPTVPPTNTLKSAPKDLDVLLVPGGNGALFGSLNETVQYIADTYPRLHSILTVCTGSFLASKAGILDGKKSTSNKETFEMVSKSNDKVDWIRKARWVVDGNIWTSSGVSAGTDAALAYISCYYGEDVADEIAKDMEYRQVKDPNDDPFAA